MVTTAMENEPVYNKRLSSVVPARITGPEKIVHDPVAGRIRTVDDDDVRDGDGCGRRRRPFIKCNDSGVRIVEAKCSKTLGEWISSSAHSSGGSFDQLVYDHVLGPDLGFSPLLFVQFTWFRCGGISVGLSWSHIIGDVFSATDFINTWGKILANDQTPSVHLTTQYTNQNDGTAFSSLDKVPNSIKMVDPVGDNWKTTNDCRMQIHSFHLTAKNLNHLLSKASETSRDNNNNNNSSAKYYQIMKPFEAISAVIWKSLAKIRSQSEPKIVTVCRNDSSSRDRSSLSLSNSQVISTVEAGNHLKVSEADLVELANLIAGKQVDERSLIEEIIMESDHNHHRQKGKSSDFIIYGAKLTFVDLEDAKIYDLELNGHKPLFANYSLNGVGEEGAVVVLPGSIDYDEGERIVNLILPENLIEDLKNELRKEWSIF